MIYFKSEDGQVFAYENKGQRDIYGAADLVPMTQSEVDSHLNSKVTGQEIKQSEIDQDKKFLADTDYITAKYGEAVMLGQDTAPMLEQYAEQLQQRESARIRIRINEGRA